MPERIRVRHKELGHVHSINVRRFDPEVWDKVDGPANQPDGRPIPPEYPSAKRTAKKAASKSGTPKPRRPSNASKTPTPEASDQPGQTAESDKEND